MLPMAARRTGRAHFFGRLFVNDVEKGGMGNGTVVAVGIFPQDALLEVADLSRNSTKLFCNTSKFLFAVQYTGGEFHAIRVRER
jgi:hypothetical protein